MEGPEERELRQQTIISSLRYYLTNCAIGERLSVNALRIRYRRDQQVRKAVEVMVAEGFVGKRPTKNQRSFIYEVIRHPDIPTLPNRVLRKDFSAPDVVHIGEKELVCDQLPC